MCNYTISSSYYSDCKLPALGEGTRSHNIITRHIYQCDKPIPAPESGKDVCAERNLIVREEIAEQGHTKLRGVCPACTAADKACMEEHVIPHANTRVGDAKRKDPVEEVPAPAVVVAPRRKSERERRKKASGGECTLL